MFLVAITLTKGPPGAKLEKRLKLSLKQVKVTKKVYRHALAIRAKKKYFKRWKIVGKIPRQISRNVYYYIKKEGGFVNGAMISTKFYPLLIPAGGLEISLLTKFLWYKQATFEKMKMLVQTLYNYNFVRNSYWRHKSRRRWNENCSEWVATFSWWPTTCKLSQFGEQWRSL